MQLTLYTDYSLRVLVYLSTKQDHKVTISEIADYFEISRNHLVKVVHHLAQIGYVHTTRGKGGGLRLAREASEINIGQVVRATENNFTIFDCYGQHGKACKILSNCFLKGVAEEAVQGFLAVLDRYTLEDVKKRTFVVEAEVV